MPLLTERRPENISSDDICPVCNRPKKKIHTIAEIQACSKKLRDIEKSGR